MRTTGIGVMYWGKTWSDDQLPYLPSVRRAGFDCAEISLLKGADIDVAAYRETLARNDLKPLCIMGLNPDTDISSPDAAIQRAGIEYVKRALGAVEKLGSPVLCGLPYIQWLYFPQDGSFEAHRNRCTGALREIAATAADHNVTVCLEVINRYETFIFNTVEDGLKFLRQIDHPSIKLHLDTFHMNMEEDDIGAAIRLAGDQLGHFHCVASNRKVPGHDLIDWDEVRRALDDIRYDGSLVVEAFPLPDTETGRTVNTWRRLCNNLDDDAREAAAFVRQRLID